VKVIPWVFVCLRGVGKPPDFMKKKAKHTLRVAKKPGDDLLGMKMYQPKLNVKQNAALDGANAECCSPMVKEMMASFRKE